MICNGTPRSGVGSELVLAGAERSCLVEAEGSEGSAVESVMVRSSGEGVGRAPESLRQHRAVPLYRES